MASNKNQHFVPRCYLKAFAIEPSRAAINLFNLDRLRFIERAPIKHQCSGSYFYGQDLLLEKALQTSEGAYAHALTEIIATDYEVTDKHRSLLRHFWLLQHLRTEAASVRALQMTSSMREAAGVPPEEFRMGIREAVLASMRAFVDEMDAVGDLKVCLLRNRTSTPFITSDNPAVLTNRWYLTSSRTQSKSFGLHSAGALLLLPLTPEILCLGYDGDVYSLPHKKGWITVKREADVTALNQHQFLNCLGNIYVKDAAHRALVCSAYDGTIHLRPNPRHKLHYAVLDGSNDEYSRYKVVGDRAMATPHDEALIHVQTIHGRPDAWPAQLRWRPGGVVYTNGTGVGYVRRAWSSTSRGPAFRKERIH